LLPLLLRRIFDGPGELKDIPLGKLRNVKSDAEPAVSGAIATPLAQEVASR
jgi:hypothetical protein